MSRKLEKPLQSASGQSASGQSASGQSAFGQSAFGQSAYGWYVVLLLMLIYTANMMDRQVINVLAEPIKHDLKISDTQLGLLTGTAFGIFYSLLGLPLARWADAHNRKRLIMSALFVWSALTSACGLAGSYAQLFAIRLGVGVGEAGGSPPSQSLISDYVPHQRRAIALSVFNLALPLGSFLGFLIGGYVNQQWGWRAAFFIAGAPGLVLLLLIFLTLKEPPRGQVDGVVSGGTAPPLKDSLKGLFARKSFIWLVLGSTCGIFMVYVSNAWLGSLFLRVHGLTPKQFGGWIALASGLGGGIGVFGGGLIADLVKGRWPMAEALVPAVSTALTTVALLVVVLVPSTGAAIAAMFVFYALAFIWLGPSSAMIQRSAPLRSRALAHGIQLFVANILALAGGPPLVGFISDLLRPSQGEMSIRYALAYASVVALFGTVFYVLASRHVVRDATLLAGEIADPVTDI